jgi:hypothetical protein
MSGYRHALERLNVRREAVIEAIAAFERLLAGREQAHHSPKRKGRRQPLERKNTSDKVGQARHDSSRVTGGPNILSRKTREPN